MAIVCGLLLLPFVVGGVFLLAKKPLLALWAFIFILPFHSLLVTILFVQIGVPLFAAKAISAWKEALLLLVVFLVLLRLPLQRLPLHLNVVDIMALLWLGQVLFYLVFQNGFLKNDMTLLARLYSARDWLLFLLPYWIGRLVLVGQKNILRIFQFILLIGVIVSLIGIFEYVFIPTEWHVQLGVPRYYAELLGKEYPSYLLGLPENYWLGTDFGHFRRAVSTFLSGQGFAIPFLLIWPVVIYNYFGKRATNLSHKIKSGLMLMICVVALFSTITRMTIIACVFQLFLFFWLAGRRKKLVQMTLLLILILIATMIISPSFRNYVILTITLQDHSGMLRPSQWKEGIQTLIKHPLGLGLGTTGQSGSRFGTGGVGQEAGYFMTTGALGLPSLLLFIGWFWGIIRYSYWGYYKYLGDRRAIALISLLTAVGILINNLTAPPNQSPFLVYIFSWLAGLSVQQASLYPLLSKTDEDTANTHFEAVRTRFVISRDYMNE